ncbi:MAG: hypothetical protein V3S07_02580 [Micropepsaceae bacterium]
MSHRSQTSFTLLAISAEAIAVDGQGNVYGAEVGPKALRKYYLPNGGSLPGAQ